MIERIKNKISFDGLILLGVFAAGFLLRAYRLGEPSLFDDELATAIRVDHPFFETISLLRQSSFPPIYYGVLNLWVSLFGNSEWSLRFPSVVFSAFTIIVIYKLGKELFNKQTGLLSAALLAFSPFAINHAQMAKMYGLFWFLGALTFLYFFRYIKDPSNKALTCYILASLLSCYTMYAGHLLLISQGIMILFMADREKWRQWFMGQGLIILACLPWVIYFLCSEKEMFHPQPSEVPYDYSGFLLKTFSWISGAYCPQWGRWTSFIYFFLIMAFCTDAFLRKNGDRRSFYTKINYQGMVLWLLLPSCIYLISNSLVLREAFAVRHIGFIQVPLILLVSSQISCFQGLMNRALAVLIVILAINNSILYFQLDLRKPKQDWRRMAHDLSHLRQKDDVVVSFTGPDMLKYYFKDDANGLHFVRNSEFSSNALMRNRILHPGTKSVFILYKDSSIQNVELEGFDFNYRASYGEIGFLHFQRRQTIGSHP